MIQKPPNRCSFVQVGRISLQTACSTQQPKSFFNKKYVGLQNPPMTYFPCYSKYKLKSLPRFTSVTWPCLVLSPELHPYRSLSPLQTHFLPAPCSSDAPGEVTPLGLCWLASSSSLKGHPHSHLLPLLLPGLCSIVLSLQTELLYVPYPVLFFFIALMLFLLCLLPVSLHRNVSATQPGSTLLCSQLSVYT